MSDDTSAYTFTIPTYQLAIFAFIVIAVICYMVYLFVIRR
jgi:hypothetical protein